MKVGDRLRLSEQGRRADHLFPDPNVLGTVVRPGRYRGGTRVTVKLDNCEKARSYWVGWWEQAVEKSD